MEIENYKPKSFWERPEGVTGGLFGLAILGSLSYILYKALPYLVSIAENSLYLGLLLTGLAALLYVIFDPKMRNLIWYIYKSIMRWITGLFVQIDPIGILKTYIETLEDNLSKMNVQISKLKGQMYKLKDLIRQNEKQIQNNLTMASQAKETDKQAMMILKSRQAGRLQDSNMKLDDLYKKMEILYRVLTKMYENSEILKEDIKDQVQVKEVERSAIRAGHSAMKSAMNIISGNKDQRYMFDMAMEAITDDVSQKIGEMERFMEMSTNFMDSVDLQNGVFEEEGMKMLEMWEKEGASLLLGNQKQEIIKESDGNLDLNTPLPMLEKSSNHKNQYDSFFEF
ncbi:MAG: hypothetical protein IPQ18_08115 [Saprospiraceae bacterium]|nr:hypothetical protein [Saprospiraceae bacterium]